VQQAIGEHSAGIKEVFTIVEDQQQAPGRQEVGERAHQPPGGHVLKSQGSGHRLGHQGRIAQVGEPGHPHAVGECSPKVGPRPNSHSSLPHARGPDQGEDRRGGQRFPDLTELSSAPYEAREFSRDAFAPRLGGGTRHFVPSLGRDAGPVNASTCIRSEVPQPLALPSSDGYPFRGGVPRSVLQAGSEPAPVWLPGTAPGSPAAPVGRHYRRPSHAICVTSQPRPT
jgi:hypothetical protein